MVEVDKGCHQARNYIAHVPPKTCRHVNDKRFARSSRNTIPKPFVYLLSRGHNETDMSFISANEFRELFL